jgi:hypothetical protein
MRKLAKENIALILALSLPIVAMIFFGLATILPKYFVAPPQYDLVFVTGYGYYYNGQLKFNIVNGKIEAQFICLNKCAAHYDLTNLHFYLFSAKSQATREIKLSLPVMPTNGKAFVVNIKVPELENIQIDSSEIAPDGYKYNAATAYRGGLLTNLIFNSASNPPTISKHGLKINIMPSDEDRYYSVKFIGWLVKDKN